MDPYLAKLFAQPNNFMLVDRLFLRISRKCDGSDAKQLRKLPKEHKVVLDVCGSHGIIGNGGFQYFSESNLVEMPGIGDSCASAISKS